MNLSFSATYVNCSNAMDWEIQQVVFDTVCDDADRSEDMRKSPCVLISRNFEFPEAATIEWYDGNDYDGGASIRSALLESTRVFIVLDKLGSIEITFELNTQQFEELKKYLSNILNGRLKLR